ncbi:MAG: hypothetical protein ABIK72_07465 [candidate division WOR-3 bacterium]
MDDILIKDIQERLERAKENYRKGIIDKDDLERFMKFCENKIKYIQEHPQEFRNPNLLVETLKLTINDIKMILQKTIGSIGSGITSGIVETIKPIIPITIIFVILFVIVMIFLKR